MRFSWGGPAAFDDKPGHSGFRESGNMGVSSFSLSSFPKDVTLPPIPKLTGMANTRTTRNEIIVIGFGDIHTALLARATLVPRTTLAPKSKLFWRMKYEDL